MCITAQSNKAPKEAFIDEPDNGCSGKPCDQPVTAENILDNFCRADFVVKVRIRKVKPPQTGGQEGASVPRLEGNQGGDEEAEEPQDRAHRPGEVLRRQGQRARGGQISS